MTITFDLLIYNGTILTVNEQFDVIQNGLLGIAGQKIVLVSAREEGQPLPEAKEIIDVQGGIVMPGLVNTHCHLPMSIFRGLADDLPLMVWLNEHIFPAENKYICSKTVRLGTLLSCAEMLLSGTTTCCDGYFFENSVAQAVKEIGIRGVLAQGIIDFPAPGIPDPALKIDNAREYIHQWLDHEALITPSVFCHSAYTCSPATLIAAKALADEHNLLFQIHAAETRDEHDLIGLAPGTSPIRHLNQLGLLDSRTLLAHTVWVDQQDIAIIAERKAGISHNPESNMKLASGAAPVPDFLKARIKVGLGTDGAASNNNLDLFQEMDTTAKLHKLLYRDPTVMDAATIIKMATIEGARAIGLGDIIGSIEIGKQADVIVLDTHKPHLLPMHNPASQIVYAAAGSDVRDVVINGSVVVRERNLDQFDLESLFNEVVAFKAAMHKKARPS